MARFSTGVLLFALLGEPVHGQQTRPVEELLAEAPEDSVSTTRVVARRCAALFALVGEDYERRRDPGTAEMYAFWSIGFAAVAARSDIELGSEPDAALQANETEIDRLTTRLRERMRTTRWMGNDRLLTSDMQTCRRLVDDFGLGSRWESADRIFFA